jgi:hypothetical protein
VHDSSRSPLELLKQQCSHVLLVLSNAQAGQQAEFLKWCLGVYSEAVRSCPGVLSVRHYEQHEVDVSKGYFPRLSFQYLTVCELSLDGAEGAKDLIERIMALYGAQAAAIAPAMWLYYPISEKVGRPAAVQPSLVTIAFANGLAGHEAEFREWYVTCHIRHALKIPALVSGQCFERTRFQQPGALDAIFAMIAMYEQEEGPEALMAGIASVPDGALNFPTMDWSRFTEWVYRPL